ncbi:ABC transporter substrate-binding protein [Caminibacter sp.]
MRVIFFLLLATFLLAKNILIINSYSVKLLWTREELKGILKLLNDKKNMNLYIEFMDTKVFRPTPSRLASFYDYLSSKYSGIKFDAVIVTDDNALNFVRKYKNGSLFKNVKVFFAGINNLSLKNKLNKNIYAGVFEKKEPLKNLELLEKTVPSLKTVYVVSDNSTSGNSVLSEYKKAFEHIKKFRFVYINTKNLEIVLHRIKDAPVNSGMLLLTPLSFYLNSEHFNYKYAISLISEYFNHPIVIHSDLYLRLRKNNIIGGKVTDGILQGETVAKKVLEYFNGKKMSDIGFTFENANKLYLNVKHLRKFGINAYSLGYKNAEYINKPDTFFYRYKNWIISFVLMFFVVIIIAVILFVKNRQLVKYNFAMRKLNRSLEDKIQEAIEELKKKEYGFSKESLRKFIKNIIFQFKYPIENLKENSIEAQYLKEKIKELETLLGDNEKTKIKIKEFLNKLAVESKLGDKIKIEGEDFELEVNIKQLKKIFNSILNSINEILSDDVKDIKIILKDNRVSIEIIHPLSIINYNEISKKILNSIYTANMFLKYYIDANLDFNFDKNLLIYEIKFSK